jgi:hypothetical protein
LVSVIALNRNIINSRKPPMPKGKTGPGHKCLVPSCQRSNVGRFGVFCSAHRQNRYRNGHPEQSAIKELELRPYVEQARKILEANRYTPLWDVLFRRWQLVGDEAEAIMAQWTRGQPMDRTRLAAAKSFIAIKSDVEVMTCMSMIVGMHLFRAARPTRFKSDEAFHFTMVRKVRGLTKSYAKSYYLPNGKLRATNYIALPIDGTRRVAEWINTVFGQVALSIVQKLEDKRRKDEEARKEFNRLVREITVDLPET